MKDHALLFRGKQGSLDKKAYICSLCGPTKIVLDIDWRCHVEVPNSKLMKGVLIAVC
jgi:hypothetical protein